MLNKIPVEFLWPILNGIRASMLLRIYITIRGAVQVKLSLLHLMRK